MNEHSKRIRGLLGEIMPALHQAGAKFTNNLRPGYGIYLRALHGLVRASVPLLQCAAAQSCRIAEQGDPLGPTLASYFEKHAREESGHDRWIVNDVEALGLDAQHHLLDPIPSGRVATLVGQQYYWIQHYHPISLMGYMMVIEGYPPTLDQLKDWQGKTGFPEGAFITLRKHALLDPFHRRDMDQLLDTLELNGAMLSMISRSAIQTVLHAVELLEDVSREAERVALAAERAVPLGSTLASSHA